MNTFERQKLIAAITTAIETVFESEDKSAVEQQDKPTEMLTIHEAAQTVKGLSEHTVRQLAAQGKIPSIRTGAGKNGKILIPKAALLDYCNGARLVG